ncbi:uncharacterized protein N7498_010936 [Penicillium cinerascens]|uniref:Uncharacterized protein n=1 Tax=Penicillium cinerascens TaxID=70096 RepID=A0A9W9M6W0_9EURO|nr:uncharacterized protein N7498_010936 [Penicillium cinerascens]KAJ5191951.1 hypothetical protein N7498_010936 [Penicillium cinerascens]
MGFISSIAHCIWDNTFSRKHRTSKPQRLDDETNDLIQSNSHNGSSLALAESNAFGSTGMYYSAHEPTPPIKSPRRKQLSPAELSLQTLFDNGKALDAGTCLTARVPDIPEYPVYKLDTTKSPTDTPAKKLESPIDPEKKDTGRKSVEWMDEKIRKEISVPKTLVEWDHAPEQKQAVSKLKRSKTGMLRRRLSRKLPRASRSSRNLRGRSSPSWIDASDLADEESLINGEEEKWLEAHGLGGGKNIGMWTGGGLGRPW